MRECGAALCCAPRDGRRRPRAPRRRWLAEPEAAAGTRVRPPATSRRRRPAGAAPRARGGRGGGGGRPTLAGGVERQRRRRPAALGRLPVALSPSATLFPSLEEKSEGRARSLARGRFLCPGAPRREGRAARRPSHLGPSARAREARRGRRAVGALAGRSLRAPPGGWGGSRVLIQSLAWEGARGHLPHPETLVPGTNCKGPFLQETGLTPIQQALWSPLQACLWDGPTVKSHFTEFQSQVPSPGGTSALPLASAPFDPCSRNKSWKSSLHWE